MQFHTWQTPAISLDHHTLSTTAFWTGPRKSGFSKDPAIFVSFFFVCLLFSSQSSGILQVLETHFTCFRDGGRNTKKWRLSSKSKSSVHLNTISFKAYTHTITCRSIHLAIPSQITSIGYVNWLKIVSNNNFSEKINTSCLREYNLTWGNNN